MPLILIVDDSPTEVHVMQKALEKHGYRTAAAADGAEGVRLAREMSPDLIFMDIGLPGMDGYEVARRLREHPALKEVKLIAVTGYGQDADRLQSQEAGFHYHLVKPVDAQKLQEVLVALMKWSGGQNSP